MPTGRAGRGGRYLWCRSATASSTAPGVDPGTTRVVPGPSAAGGDARRGRRSRCSGRRPGVRSPDPLPLEDGLHLIEITLLQPQCHVVHLRGMPVPADDLVHGWPPGRRICCSRFCRCATYSSMSAAGSSTIGPCPGSSRRGPRSRTSWSDARYARRSPPFRAEVHHEATIGQAPQIDPARTL